MNVFVVLATLRIKEGGKEGRPTLGNAQLKADLQLDTAGVGSCPLHPAQILLCYMSHRCSLLGPVACLPHSTISPARPEQGRYPTVPANSAPGSRGAFSSHSRPRQVNMGLS